MKIVLISTMLLCVVANLASPQPTSASGTLLEISPDDACLNQSPQKVTFSPAPFTYVFGGICNLIHTRLSLPVNVPWTGVGTYDPTTGKTTEDINVPAPAINQPSRPYGRFLASMHCLADPWQDANVKCDQVAASSNPPASAYPPNPFGDYSRTLISQIVGNIQSYRRPYTSGMEDNQRKFLNAQYAAYVAAERKSQLLQQGAKQSSGAYLTLIHPSVLAPTTGQIFPAQTPVPIRLAPPKGWNVTGYLLNIQRKDPKGNWIAHATIPVGAAEAQSAAGYRGFGGGAPPAFLAVPGVYRMNAQASYPNQSGVSEWVEFNAREYQDAFNKRKPSTSLNPFLKP
jgi:hypothetical protein